MNYNICRWYSRLFFFTWRILPTYFRASTYFLPIYHLKLLRLKRDWYLNFFFWLKLRQFHPHYSRSPRSPQNYSDFLVDGWEGVRMHVNSSLALNQTPNLWGQRNVVGQKVISLLPFSSHFFFFLQVWMAFCMRIRWQDILKGILESRQAFKMYRLVW